MTIENNCPCCSGLDYSSCCKPFLTGKSKPTTSEALMRSRYTANVFKNGDYLLLTWHDSTRPKAINMDNIPDFNDLEIIQREAGKEKDDHGVVEFKAKYSDQQSKGILHETSRFIKKKDQWLYVDGDIHESSISATKRIRRNEPCPCGSGKKFKKCCAS